MNIRPKKGIIIIIHRVNKILNVDLLNGLLLVLCFLFPPGCIQKVKSSSAMVVQSKGFALEGREV